MWASHPATATQPTLALGVVSRESKAQLLSYQTGVDVDARIENSLHVRMEPCRDAADDASIRPVDY